MSKVRTKDFFPEPSMREKAVEDGWASYEVNRFNRYTDDSLVGKWWEVFPFPNKPVVVKEPDTKYQLEIEAIELFRTGKIDFKETKKRLGW